ncbi:predicted protein [Nematostella vectensis]|uniref:MyTH4 domain-containing protein n=1 Tax=Nematostella vectensis TaxID=45351 RepID=A7SM17_NEMVE|nr:predicted protein [Nematostella vectensis]|eukprot:XP_001627349.1 predicted protein [Nematostella vectensis]
MRLNEHTEPHDLSLYKFMTYARKNFQGEAPCWFKKGSLREPLLHHEDKMEAEAALTIYVAIQRFMIDLPEPKVEELEDSPKDAQLQLPGGLLLRSLPGRPLTEQFPDQEEHTEPHDLSLYKFMTYARKNFQGEAPCWFKKGSLREPLLHHEDKMEAELQENFLYSVRLSQGPLFHI